MTASWSWLRGRVRHHRAVDLEGVDADSGRGGRAGSRRSRSRRGRRAGPARRSSVSRSIASSGLRMSSLSETSSSRHAGGRPVSSSTRRTSFTSAACASWRCGDVDRHHQPLVPGLVPLAAPAAQAARSVHWPSGTASPRDVGERDEVGRALDARGRGASAAATRRRRWRRSRTRPPAASRARARPAPAPGAGRLLRLPLGGERPRAGRVDVPGVAAPLLGPLHGHGGALQQRLGVGAVVREEGDPEARGHEQVVAPDAEGAAQREAQLVGDHRHVLVPLEAREQDGEHVAARRGRSCRPDAGCSRERGPRSRSRSSPWLRPSRSLTLREAVEAELDDGELLPVPLGVDDRHSEAVAEAAGAGEAGERVLVGESARSSCSEPRRAPRAPASGPPRGARPPRAATGFPPPSWTSRAAKRRLERPPGVGGRAGSARTARSGSAGRRGARAARRLLGAVARQRPQRAPGASDSAWRGEQTLADAAHPVGQGASPPRLRDRLAQAGPLRVEPGRVARERRRRRRRPGPHGRRRA